jgi:predicted Rossmann-fold nucleotide-binding protein
MRICIFCGSSTGDDPAYGEGAAVAARSIALSGDALVYGGGRVGLMGVVADALSAQAGKSSA